MSQRKKVKKGHLNEFVLGEDGKYKYSGAVVEIGSDKRPFKKFARLLWAWVLICAALQIMCGCIPVDGMNNTFYVILPYGAGVISTGVLLYYIPGLTSKDGKIREYIYEKNRKIINVCSLCDAAFCTVTLIGEIVFVITNGFSEGALLSVVFMASHVIAAASALIARKTVAEIDVKKVKGELPGGKNADEADGK